MAHLEYIGYSGAAATLAMTCVFGFAAIGKIVMGLLAARLKGALA